MTAPGKPEPRKFAANQRMTLKQITGPGKGGACMGVSVVFKRKLLIIQLFQCIWRKGWDSNPRYPCGHAGFQDRCLKPLGHPSDSGISIAYRTLRLNATRTWSRHDCRDANTSVTSRRPLRFGRGLAVPYRPQRSTTGSRVRAISIRPARVAGCNGCSGWRTVSEAMTPPSRISTLQAARPHWRFS